MPAKPGWKVCDPKQNRTIPPLQHERVVALKQRRPHLVIELNGGLETTNDCLEALQRCDGAMVGRAAYAHPLRWTDVDALIYGDNPRQVLASDVVNGLIPHAAKHLGRGSHLWDHADISFSWLKASGSTPLAPNLANEPNIRELISMCWKRPANNCGMLASGALTLRTSVAE